tara:strand:- start:233 stop:520 length:288 start_codon:yes stop_codon:yes gene_type:complete
MGDVLLFGDQHGLDAKLAAQFLGDEPGLFRVRVGQMDVNDQILAVGRRAVGVKAAGHQAALGEHADYPGQGARVGQGLNGKALRRQCLALAPGGA